MPALPEAMSLLVWNYCRLRNLRTEDQLADFAWAKDPSIVFLAETWTNKARLEQVKRRIQFKNLFVVPRCNKAGWLAILWKEGFPLEVVKYSKNYIDFVIIKGKENAWRFTGFYGEPDTIKRHEAWSKLRALKNLGSLPWLCAGDFNEIT